MSGSDRQQVTLLNMLERIRSNESHNPFLVCIDNDIDSLQWGTCFGKKKGIQDFMKMVLRKICTMTSWNSFTKNISRGLRQYYQLCPRFEALDSTINWQYLEALDSTINSGPHQMPQKIKLNTAWSLQLPIWVQFSRIYKKERDTVSIYQYLFQ